MRFAISVFGCAFFYFLSLTIGNKPFFDQYHVDKVFHFGTSVFVALFFSVFFDDIRAIIVLSLLVGFFWEVLQFYQEFTVPYADMGLREFLLDSAGDLIADIVGVAAYVLFLHPYTE